MPYIRKGRVVFKVVKRNGKKKLVRVGRSKSVEMAKRYLRKLYKVSY